MKIIEGGVCAAKGFKAGSVRCGVKESRTNDDTAIIFSECECTAAATYTMNRVKAAPLYVTMEHLEDGVARAIVANAGNANACAPDGMENARRMAKAAAQLLGVAETDVAVASTGVIGQRLNIECIEEHLPELKLEDNASEKANRAIMTTDTKPKTAAVEFTIGGKTCRIFTGSYTGTGTSAAAIDCPFYPALALVQASGGSAPVAMVRTAEASSGHQDFSITGSTLSVGWGKHSVSWRSTVNAPTNTMAERAGNSSGKVYFYVVLGYDDAAE